MCHQGRQRAIFVVGCWREDMVRHSNSEIGIWQGGCSELSEFSNEYTIAIVPQMRRGRNGKMRRGRDSW